METVTWDWGTGWRGRDTMGLILTRGSTAPPAAPLTGPGATPSLRMIWVPGVMGWYPLLRPESACWPAAGWSRTGVLDTVTWLCLARWMMLDTAVLGEAELVRVTPPRLTMRACWPGDLSLVTTGAVGGTMVSWAAGTMRRGVDTGLATISLPPGVIAVMLRAPLLPLVTILRAPPPLVSICAGWSGAPLLLTIWPPAVSWRGWPGARLVSWRPPVVSFRVCVAPGPVAFRSGMLMVVPWSGEEPGAARMISWGVGEHSRDRDSGVIIPLTLTWLGLLGALLLLARYGVLQIIIN